MANTHRDGYANGSGPARPPAIEMIGLTKRYGPEVAVAGLDLRVTHGEVFGFLGPNGAGKTTTIGMILGLLRPSGGSVRLFGQPLPGNERAVLRRVGALVETPTFYPYLGARDNLRAVAMSTGGVGERRVDEILALVGLREAAAKPFRTYSLGMKQRLGIGAALLADPDLVILDEPTNGLDPAGIVEIRHLLRELAANGKAVFLSSHQLNEVQQLCDRVAIVHGGRVVAEGTVTELLSEQQGWRATVSDLPTALAAARSLEWVRQAFAQGQTLCIHGDPPSPFSLSEAMANAGVWISALERSEGSLEALFLRLTGTGRAALPESASSSPPAFSNGHAAAPLLEEISLGSR